MKRIMIVIYLLTFTFSFVSVSIGQKLERKNIPLQYKWNLSILYPNAQAWHSDLKAISKKAEKLKYFKGKLGKNAKMFSEALRLYSNVLKDYYKLSEYAERLSDQDLRNSENQKLVQESAHLGSKIDEITAYMDPEILTIGSAKISSFFNERKDLQEFKFFVNNILRLKKHTLDAEGEKILASATPLRRIMPEVRSIFENAEKPYAKVKLSNGQEIKLTSSNYVKYRTLPNRADRARVFGAFFGNYGKFKNTLGAILAGKCQVDYFFAKNRNYKSVLQYSMDKVDVPTKVYTNLIKQINKNLPTLYRFLKLKKRMLGVDTLHYYDLYTPIVKKVDMKFTIPEGQKILLNVFKVYGKKYVNMVKKAFAQRWIDYYPTPGKRSGAYSDGAAYDYHPYILMNWTGDYESLTTLAHELGHTMHSYFSNKNQPFIEAQYPTFVAEIASTCNETLLNDYMVKHAKTDKQKLFLLGSYLELLRTTIFRQTSFAEFEWDIHKKIEQGKPLTGDIMSKIYYNIVRKYYGADKGIAAVDPYIAYEWAYIPHFVMYTYYVYQYSTSLIYATAFASKIINEGEPAVKKYFNILKGGDSDFPLNLIKKAGINPLSSEAFDLTMKRMNHVMDEIEQILNKHKK